MSFRDDIINSALNWADPGQYKPTASELMSLFTDCSTQQAPSQDEAQKSLDKLGTGCYVGGQVKRWCGIFCLFRSNQCGTEYASVGFDVGAD